MIDITLIILISFLILFFILIFVWREIFRLQKEIKQKTKLFDTSFDKLLKGIEKEIEFLDGQPGLSEEERKLRDKLFEIIESSKEMVKKGIEDVEKKRE